MPYINSAYMQLIGKFTKKSFFAFDIKNFQNNIDEIAKAAVYNNQQIINLGNSKIIKNTEGIKSLNIKNLS